MLFDLLQPDWLLLIDQGQSYYYFIHNYLGEAVDFLPAKWSWYSLSFILYNIYP